MPRHLHVALLVAFSTQGAASFAYSAVDPLCKGLAPATVSVTPLWSAPDYFSNQSIAALTKKSNPAPPQKTLGLTTANQKVSISVKYAYRTNAGTGAACVSPTIDVSAGYSPVRVDVASEFRKGTCAYAEVLAHEDKHVQIYREHLKQVIPQIREEITQHFANGPFFAKAGELHTYFDASQNFWAGRIKALLASAEIAQNRLDSPAEYTRLSLACEGELQRAIPR